jgi:ribonuclease BN (tRNA processing enzyme)
MKVTALGVHSAFAVGNVYETDQGQTVYDPKFQSNFLLEFNTKGKVRDDVFRFVIDFGSDIRHSLLYSANLKMGDIDAWYCSHPHADHCGGIEGIALSTLFNPYWNKSKSEGITQPIAEYLASGLELPPQLKPSLYGHREVLRSVWEAAAPGLNTLQGVDQSSLSTFFDVKPMGNGLKETIKDGDREWSFYTIESTHVVGGMEHMPSFGLMFECSDGQKVYFPTDTLLMMPPTMELFYRKANVVYQDCETGFRSGVHSHIDDIRKVDSEIKKKCYLYHYNDKPEVDDGEFAGVLETGEFHYY